MEKLPLYYPYGRLDMYRYVEVGEDLMILCSIGVDLKYGENLVLKKLDPIPPDGFFTIVEWDVTGKGEDDTRYTCNRSTLIKVEPDIAYGDPPPNGVEEKKARIKDKIKQRLNSPTSAGYFFVKTIINPPQNSEGGSVTNTIGKDDPLEID